MARDDEMTAAELKKRENAYFRPSPAEVSAQVFMKREMFGRQFCSMAWLMSEVVIQLLRRQARMPQQGEVVEKTGRARFSTAVHAARLAACSIALATLPAAAAEWRVMTLNDKATVAAPVVHFDVDGAFSGTTGCNRFQGKVRMDGDDLVIDGPVATTRMACPGGVLTTQDDAIIALLGGRVSVTFDPLRDILRLSKEETAIELKQVMMSGPDVPETHAGLERPAGAPRYLAAFGIAGQLDIRSERKLDADIVGGVDPGTLVRNGGCVEDGGLRWCEVATLDGTLMGWAEAEPLMPADNVLRAGQGAYDATGLVPCAVGLGAPMGQCAFGLARDSGGAATVVVTKPDGIERILFFADGAFLSTDRSQAGGGFEHSASRESDLNLIRVDDERYENPDAVLF